jgi:cell division protein FtsB
MNKNFLNTKVIMSLIGIYLVFLVGKMFYQSYEVNKEIDAIAGEIQKTKETNRELTEKIIYYKSGSYKERIARERLGMQKPGEEVIVILPEEKRPEDENAENNKTPNYIKWWKYFFS